MATKQEELKSLTAQKKELADRQKAIRDELNATKDDRKESRKVQAQARKDVKGQKTALRDLTASVKETFKEGDLVAIESLADSIMETATELAATVRSFAEAGKEPETEDEEEI
tara:strand:- start:32015 stop:32353 length:339 start_codon:yes stop_codon:yes gene_type:complete